MPDKKRIYHFALNGKKIDVVFEKYINFFDVSSTAQSSLKKEITDLLVNSWGAFPEDFVGQHIFTSQYIFVARYEQKCIAFCAMSIKKILGLDIHYVEFLVVDKNFQKSGIGSYLFFVCIKEQIFKKIVQIVFGKPLEVVFITPNIRTLAHTARFASFIYPDPYSADKNGMILPADEKTWLIAKELLKNSDNPNRNLEREGLVLKQSYVNTPWLIYNNDNAPWHGNAKINTFAKRYLMYHSAEDREFIVRARIGLSSFIKYILYA